MERRGVGFTLIELLIAVTIFSIIAISLHSSFNAGLKVWRKSEENMELNHSVRLALEGIGKELRNAINIPEEPAPAEEPKEKKKQPGLSREEETKEEPLIPSPELGFSGTANTIGFVTQVTRILGDGSLRRELAKVDYKVGGENELIRRLVFQSDGFSASIELPTEGEELLLGIEKDEGEALVESVEELKFEYSYESSDEEELPEWKDNWENQEGIPLGVKVHLKVKRKRGDIGEFLKTVYIPTGVLGKEEELTEIQEIVTK